MRIYLNTTSNKEIVPFDYQQKLTGVLHKWLGENVLHDGISMYSFSWLMDGKLTKKGFDFKNGAKWFISFYNDKYIKDIVRTILEEPEMFCGLVVSDISIQDSSDLELQDCFRFASPVFIKRRFSDNTRFYTFEDVEANELMTETIKHKMELAGLPADDTLKISFDLDYPMKKIKKVRIHNIDNKCSMCPVKIEAKADTKRFIWTVGLGNSTGSGFGAIY